MKSVFLASLFFVASVASADSGAAECRIRTTDKTSPLLSGSVVSVNPGFDSPYEVKFEGVTVSMTTYNGKLQRLILQITHKNGSQSTLRAPIRDKYPGLDYQSGDEYVEVSCAIK